MIESLPSDDPSPQKRRSTRIVQAVPITVTGVDALGQPFKERTTTVMVNCHGCKYQSKHYVPKNSTVTLEIPCPEPASHPRGAVGRVVWVQRPRAVRELFQIGVEFESAGNVWGIAFPPNDWFARAEDATSSTAAPPQAASVSEAKSSTEQKAGPLPHATTGNAQAPTTSSAISATGTATLSATQEAASAAASSDSKIHLMPVPQPSHEAPLDTARQVARMIAEAKESIEKSARREAQTAINDEMIVVRQLLDAQLHETIERTIKYSIERMSESEARKIIQQAERRTTDIVEEARKTQETAGGQLDAKIRHAVEQAVNRAAEQAAQQAAAQAITQNLKQTVEQVVAQVITEREATLPSLQILSSPEAAQHQLEQWKKNLEETSQSVRSQASEQTQSDAAAVSRRCHEEMEASLSRASQRLGEKLHEASQNALAQAGEDFAARIVSLRGSLDGAVDAARAAVQSLTAGLEQERVRTEQTKAQIADTAQSAIERTRQQCDEMLSTHYTQIGQRADQVIAERTQNLEPVLHDSAQKVIEQFSGELDRKLSPGLDEARRVQSELLHAREQAERTQENLHEKIHQASEQAVGESLDRLRQEAAKYPAEFEESCRSALSKVESELGQKSSEIQHETYEALLKAADWYQKKAQNTMQSALEKVIERSAEALRDRAAEVSSLVASELDHHRRTYLDHSQAQIEEAAKEVVDRQRGRLNESAEIANATFTDRVQHVSAESLRRFNEASSSALEKARSDMEYDRENSLTQFQKTLDERMTQGADQARTYLQSQLVPMMESWESSRRAQQQEWIEQLKTSTDELIEQYKTRLGNASNAWLLASATTLGQNSQAVLDTLAKSAEKRLREIFTEALAGMGDTLKERLLGLSSNFGPDDSEGTPPKK